MDSYFKESNHPFAPQVPLREMCSRQPIVPVSRTSEWEVVSSPNRFMRTFEITNPSALSAFVSEILQYQEENQHHGKLTLEHQKVIVEVYTHDINDITELDHEYIDMVDKILQDVMHYVDYNGNGDLGYGY
tara:strand:+ start:441 stop:833 length:393 start_codon:yes stop_codon:yes gene_type:complete